MPLKTLIIISAILSFNANAACDSKEYREFDFWLGKWQVTSAQDDVIRHNNIHIINNGCTLLEEYTTPSGYQGKSFNIYDKSTGLWHQTWVDNTGVLLKLSGGIIGDSMIMTGTTINKKQTTLNKITWTPNSNNTVRQHWQVSNDNGVTWQTLFDGLYSKSSK